MTGRFRWVHILPSAIVALLLLPFAAIEGVYHWQLADLARPEPVDRAQPFPSIARRAAWDAMNEQLPIRVDPISASELVLTVLLTQRPIRSSGQQAANWVARLHLAGLKLPGKGLALREAALSLWLTRHWSGDQVVDYWIANVYVGHGAYGLEAGARRYFDIDMQEAAPEQIALLIGLTQAPSRYDPCRHPKAARERRNYVLVRMHELGVLREGAMRRAIVSSIDIRPALCASMEGTSSHP